MVSVINTLRKITEISERIEEVVERLNRRREDVVMDDDVQRMIKHVKMRDDKIQLLQTMIEGENCHNINHSLMNIHSRSHFVDHIQNCTITRSTNP